jgi:hypothetical protein
MLNVHVASAYADARRLAGAEMKLERHGWQRLFPEECPWTLDELLDPDYLPAPERRR